MKLTHGRSSIDRLAQQPWRRIPYAACRVSLCIDRIKLAVSLQLETLKTLEWPRVCTQLSAFTSTSMGLGAAQRAAVPLGRSPEETKRLLEQTSAAVEVSRPLDFEGIEDVSRIVDVAVSGEMLSVGELCSVSRTLKSARSLAGQLEEVNESERCFPLLQILEKCDFLTELEQKIEFCIDCSFLVILDQASEELEFIRSERKRNIENLEAMLKQISTNIFQAGGISKPFVTKRRSRMCVAVRATHRSLLQGGVVLDSSSSGATYFMEPREAIDLNNLEVRLKDSEKMEERAILSYLSAEVGKACDKIKFLLDRVLELDLAFARAGHARWINGVCPVISSNNFEGSNECSLSVDVNALQHPLLLEPSLRSPSSNIPVPVDFKIGKGVKIVVISGPNTGGKTASMKNLGLAALMLKAGMYLSAQYQSKIPWFDHVLADIGDHQSLEQNLSTFSGHISQICKIVKVASERSLVLLDEIGSGTDPSEGVALSTSILQYLKNRVNLAVVTTHYADLTLLKDNDARFENAAMEFSLEDLKPTYRILWGSTGQSNALSIAERIGFDAKIVERARLWVEKLTPEKMHNLNSLLYQSLTDEREKLKAQAETAESLHSDVMELYREIRNEADNLDVREAALKAKKAQEVRHEVEMATMRIDSVVKDFEEQLNHANPNEYNALLKRSEAEIASIVEAHQPFEHDTSIQKKETTDLYTPQIGEKVLIKNLGNKLATTVESPSDDNTVLVQYGKITVRVHLSSISSLADRNGAVASAHVSKKQGQRKKRLKNLKILSETMKKGEDSYGPKVQTSKNTLDLRGKRVEEASMELEMAINGRGPNSVLFIIHGMGSGVLKEHVLQLLSKHPRISKFEQESPMNYGCTVAYIK